MGYEAIVWNFHTPDSYEISQKWIYTHQKKQSTDYKIENCNQNTSEVWEKRIQFNSNSKASDIEILLWSKNRRKFITSLEIKILDLTPPISMEFSLLLILVE